MNDRDKKPAAMDGSSSVRLTRRRILQGAGGVLAAAAIPAGARNRARAEIGRLKYETGRFGIGFSPVRRRAHIRNVANVGSADDNASPEWERQSFVGACETIGG